VYHSNGVGGFTGGTFTCRDGYEGHNGGVLVMEELHANKSHTIDYNSYNCKCKGHFVLFMKSVK
jgi:hypothetical protein